MLLLVNGGLRTMFKRLPVPDHTFAVVACQFEILREFERIGRACVFAQTAEHAATQIIGEVDQLFAASLFVALTGYDNQIFRTSERAQIT